MEEFMKETIKKYLEEFKIGTKSMFKEFFNKETNKKYVIFFICYSEIMLI